MNSVPFQERMSPLRGFLDLATGCYPAFLFGGGIGDLLPVFHFHKVTQEYLEPYLVYLAENGYRTVTSEAVASLVKSGKHPGPKSVALCFDDAWASLWTVAAPLLKRFNLNAIAFVIPGRVQDADHVRTTLNDTVTPRRDADESESPFATWPELKALHESGRVDIQSHTYWHAKIFCDDRLIGFINPAHPPPPLDRPAVATPVDPTFLSTADLGAPLYPTRSRMSDALRYFDDPKSRDRCKAYVQAHGAASFFDRPDWEQELRPLVRRGAGRYETAEVQHRSIFRDLQDARDILNARLKTNSVRHICFPWAIAGQVAEEAARKAGYETAYADRLFGMRAVRAGDDPYRLMRLKHEYIYCLPGPGRKWFIQIGRNK